jgi:hypothetical protein
VDHLLGKFLAEFREGIDPVLTRDFLPPKPRPEGIWEIASRWGLDGDGSEDKGAEGLIMVGFALLSFHGLFCANGLTDR